MADQETAVKITGDSASAVAAMKAASSAVTGGVGEMKGALNGIGEAFGKLNGVFAGLAAIVGGGAFFKEAIGESNKLTLETTRLARTLGITTEEANTLNTALGDIYSDSDTYIGSFQKFTGQLRRNEDGLRAMGLQTRDASGHLRDGNVVFSEAIAMVGKYKPGLDQTAAAQTLFGKSIDDVMKLQKLNTQVLEDAKQKNQELNMVITDENVAASKAYKAAMNDVGDVMTGIMKTVGDAVMPVFTELANYLASTGPTVIAIFKGALTGLLLVFRTLEMVVKTVMSVIFEAINTTIDQLGNLGDIISRVLSGDFAGAAKAAGAMQDRWVQAFTNIKGAAVDAYSTATEKFGGDLERTWGEKIAAKTPAAKGSAQMGDLKPPKPVKDESRMAVWDAELETRKVTFQKENDLREMSKAQELKYWQDIAALPDLSAKERVSVKKKLAVEELAVMKAQREQELALSEQSIAAYKEAQMSVIDATRQENQFKVDTLQMTNAEMLQSEQKLERDRYRIMKEAVDARMALLKLDPTKNVVALAKLNDELAAVEKEHSLKARGIELQSQKERVKDYQDLFNTIGNSFSKAISGIIQGTMTMGQAVRGIFQGILGAVADYIGQMIAKKLVGLAMDKVIGASEIATQAGVAGAGAAAAVAPIPIVGPAMAIAAMGTVSSAVMGMQAVASARNGYDIPAGVNPLTQLHEREMVLPQEQADAVRNATGGGGGNSLTVHTLDAKSFESWLKGSGGDTLLKYMGGRKRDFAYK
jgi:hypothetical protein